MGDSGGVASAAAAVVGGPWGGCYPAREPPLPQLLLMLLGVDYVTTAAAGDLCEWVTVAVLLPLLLLRLLQG